MLKILQETKKIQNNSHLDPKSIFAYQSKIIEFEVSSSINRR